MDPSRSGSMLFEHLRLYHHPVGVFFERQGSAPRARPGVSPRNRLSFCQFLAFARQVGHTVSVMPDKLDCSTAVDVFGFKQEGQRAIKTLRYYLGSKAEEFYHQRSRFPLGEIASVGLSPLSLCEERPDAVVMVVDSLQCAHLLDFYIRGSGATRVDLSHVVNGAACANTVEAVLKRRPQVAFPCPGAFTSGKVERGEMFLAFGWTQFEQTMEVLAERARKGRVSLLGGASLVGNDVCRNCPRIKFDKVD